MDVEEAAAVVMKQNPLRKQLLLRLRKLFLHRQIPPLLLQFP